MWTDADMTYPNERIPEFVRYLDDNPTSTRSSARAPPRRAPTSSPRPGEVGDPQDRRARCPRPTIPDLNSGLRAFRREVSLPYLRLLPPGFSCVTTITLSFLSNQHDVEYVPIDYAKRAGISKFHFVRDAYRYILQVLRMVMYFNPIKVLMPLRCGSWASASSSWSSTSWSTTTATSPPRRCCCCLGFLIAVLALIGDLVVRSRTS